MVDLHDLNVKLALAAVDAVGSIAEMLDAGAVGFVTGRGHHSVVAPAMADAVRSRLGKIARRSGWSLGLARAGRFVLIVDPRRAPPAATGGINGFLWAFGALFGLAAGYAWPPLGVVIGLIVLAWGVRAVLARLRGS